jgi:hypothetical protein
MHIFLCFSPSKYGKRKGKRKKKTTNLLSACNLFVHPNSKTQVVNTNFLEKQQREKKKATTRQAHASRLCFLFTDIKRSTCIITHHIVTRGNNFTSPET